jgi:hypothetical protein
MINTQLPSSVFRGGLDEMNGLRLANVSAVSPDSDTGTAVPPGNSVSEGDDNTQNAPATTTNTRTANIPRIIRFGPSIDIGDRTPADRESDGWLTSLGSFASFALLGSFMAFTLKKICENLWQTVETNSDPTNRSTPY